MEETKNNKGLIVLVCILSILVLALGGFIVYDKYYNSNVNDNNENNCETKNEDNLNTTDDKIKVSIEKNKKTGYYNELVINGKTIKAEYETIDSVIFLDDSYIIAVYKDDIEGFSRYYVYNKSGERLYNVNELSSLNNAKTTELSYIEGKLVIEAVTTLAGDNYQSLCYLNQSDTYMKFEQIKYLGNGKFDQAETLSSLTLKDYLKNNYNYICD